jgi:hypothetical protein
MAYVTGALNCAVAPVTVLNSVLVCQPALKISLVRGLTYFRWQAAWQRGVPVWSLVETNNASAICRVKAPLSRAEVTMLMAIVPFTAAWPPLAYPGSWGYVESLTVRKWSHLL